MNTATAPADRKVAYDSLKEAEDAIENLLGPEALAQLDLSSLPPELFEMFGQEHVDPRDPYVKDQMLRHIQSNKGEAAQRLLSHIFAAEGIGDIQQRLVQGEELSPEESSQIRGKLNAVLNDLRSGSSPGKTVGKNMRNIVYGKGKTVRNETVNIGRNAPCPCGSGRKYKKCCLRK